MSNLAMQAALQKKAAQQPTQSGMSDKKKKDIIQALLGGQMKEQRFDVPEMKVQALNLPQSQVDNVMVEEKQKQFSKLRNLMGY